MKEMIYDINIENTFILNKFKNSVILDIETTGLSKKYDSIFLIGLMEIKEKTEIKLFFAENPKEEYKLIKSIKEYLDKNIITYNGNSFDIPFIKEKAELYNIDIPFINGFDLYRYILKQKYLLNLKNYKQKSIEEYMGLFRNDFISGGEVVKRYKDFLITKEYSLFEDVIIHNRDDIYGLLKSLEIVEKIDKINSITIGNKIFIIKNISFFENTLIINGNLNFKDENFYNMFNYSIITTNRTFKIEIPTLKSRYDIKRYCNYIMKKDFSGVLNIERIPSPEEILILKTDRILYNNIHEIVKYILEKHF